MTSIGRLLNRLFGVNARANTGPVRWSHHIRTECYDKDGNLKWVDESDNLVVTTGLNDMLDKYYKGSGYTAGHFVGLTDGTPTVVAGDTMASHAGWVEVTDYTEGTREALVMGTPAAGSVDNSASKAEFTINATVTVGGYFLGTNSTKGGSTGTLVGAVAFTGGDRAVVNLDTLRVTVTATLTS